MNMDELLKNIWSAEEAQTMAARQGSLTLPRTLTGGSNLPQRQPTLGEMTLEEFLVRAGVVREDTQLAGKPNNGGFFGDLANLGNGNGLGIAFQQMGIRNGMVGISDSGINGNLVQSSVLHGGGMGMVGLGAGGATIASGSPANQSSDGIGKSNGDTSSVSPVPYAFNGGIRGRKCSGAVEKVIERRQRRMIKNRESAARSRARKQAYTMELEAEVAKLKEKNEELEKKQAEMMEMQKNQVMEMMNLQREVKKRCLRRTLTGPW
ncbi:unnamed protein product, partial [Vitis vinifera]